jgi:branched-chain amino acid transport system permease protein
LQEFRDPIGLSLVVLVLLMRPNGLLPSAVLKAEKV